MSDLIDRQALLKQIDIDSDGEPGYYGDTWKFIDTIKSMPPAELSTNLAEVGTDAISRQSVIDILDETKRIARQNIDGAVLMTFERVFDSLVNITNALPTIQPEPHEIGYDDCSNALLKMWMDNVLTDGDYYRIADKLNKKWGKIELPEPYTEPFKGVTE